MVKQRLSALASASRIPILALCAGLAGVLMQNRCWAEDLTTIDGKRYENVRDINPSRDGLVISYGPEADPGRTKLFFRNLPYEIRKRYNYDAFEEGLSNARFNTPISLTLNNAFRLSSLEAAKKKAQAEHKLLGFIMVWDMMFQPCKPLDEASPGGLAHFYTVFNNALVLVFVRHEDELPGVPLAVGKGFFGPDEGGMAPNMAVVTADCSQFICEIPLGGKHSTGGVREPIFRDKIAVIKQFLANPEAFAPKPVEQTNSAGTGDAGSATAQPAKADGDPAEIIPGQPLEGIRKIPQSARLLYGGIAIGALALVVAALRLLRNRAG
jgi:hypothetical protein